MGGDRKVLNVDNCLKITTKGGNLTIDAHNNLVSIDKIDCDLGSLRVGGIDQNGDPESTNKLAMAK